MFCASDCPATEVRRCASSSFFSHVAAALLCAGVATAGNGPAKFRFTFQGQLTATPANGGVSITVQGGNKAALRAMLGQPVTQTFAYGVDHRVPEVVARRSHRRAGRRSRGRRLRHGERARPAQLGSRRRSSSSRPAIVGDHGTTLYTPDKPLYLFRGTLTSVGSSSVTVHVTGGDHRALRLLIGSSNDQTFAFGDTTIFLLWQGKVPTVIDASKLVVGDKIVVRIRADKGATLAQVESTPANHIGDREPAAK